MRRENPDITQDIERRLIQCRADYEACREIAQLKDNPGWGRMRTILQANIEALKSQRADFQKINEHGLRFILKEEQDFEFVLNSVDKVDEKMDELQETISELTSKLNERKRNPTPASTIPGV